jgi:hypothetical protein
MATQEPHRQQESALLWHGATMAIDGISDMVVEHDDIKIALTPTA